jgi:hypothetical protein
MMINIQDNTTGKRFDKETDQPGQLVRGVCYIFTEHHLNLLIESACALRKECYLNVEATDAHLMFKLMRRTQSDTEAYVPFANAGHHWYKGHKPGDLFWTDSTRSKVVYTENANGKMRFILTQQQIIENITVTCLDNILLQVFRKALNLGHIPQVYGRNKAPRSTGQR